VTGCGGAGSGKAQTVAQDPPASSQSTIDQVLAGQPPAAATLPAPTSNQLCDAPSLAYLVGRPRMEIPVPVDPSHRRVACTTCLAPQDYQPDRTDILFDAKTGLVTAVKCG
jgi:hypothetical protein